jgi:hypothetical protein
MPTKQASTTTRITFMQPANPPSIDSPLRSYYVNVPTKLYTWLKLAVPFDQSLKQFLENSVPDGLKAMRREAWGQDMEAQPESSAHPIQEPGQHATPTPSWNDVEIRLYATNRLGLSTAGGARTMVPLSGVGLTHPRTGQPSKQFAVLCGLAHGRRLGMGKIAIAKDKTCKSRLCKSLRLLTGIRDDPFFPRDQMDGYKPRFTLVDCRSDAARRAKRYAFEEQFSETRDYAIEPDDAGKWLEENEQ